MTAPRVLITGARGFLGRHLLEAFRAQWPEASISALVRSSASWRAEPWTSRHPDVALIEGRLETVGAWSSGMQRGSLDVIIHMAATVEHRRNGDPRQGLDDVHAVVEMVRLAARTGARLVHLSSSGTVGCSRDPQAMPDEDAPFALAETARWPYYARKIEAEQLARRNAAELGVTLTMLRPPILLGPDDHRGRSTQHVRRLLEGRLPFLLKGGISYCDVRDVAAAIVSAARTESPRPVYNLPGTASTLVEFFRLAGEIAGKAPPSLVVPPGLARWLAVLLRPLHVIPDPVVFEMAARYWGISSRYAAEIGYRSRPARETITDTVASIRASASR